MNFSWTGLGAFANGQLSRLGHRPAQNDSTGGGRLLRLRLAQSFGHNEQRTNEKEAEDKKEKEIRFNPVNSLETILTTATIT